MASRRASCCGPDARRGHYHNTKGVSFEMELVKAGICHHLGTWLISSQDSSQQSYLFLFLEIPRKKVSLSKKRLRKAPEATSKGPVKDRLCLAGMTADRSGSLHAWHQSKAGFAGILNLALKRPRGFRRMTAVWAKIHTSSSHQRTWKQRRPGRPTRTCTIHFDRRKSAPVTSNGATLLSSRSLRKTGCIRAPWAHVPRAVMIEMSTAKFRGSLGQVGTA